MTRDATRFPTISGDHTVRTGARLQQLLVDARQHAAAQVPASAPEASHKAPASPPAKGTSPDAASKTLVWPPAAWSRPERSTAAASPRSRRAGKIRRRRGRAHTPGIAARAITGHLVVTEERVSAWYVLTPQTWSFATTAKRDQLVLAAAGRLGRLIGRRCQLRITSHPFSARTWAQDLDEDVHAAGQVLPGACPLPEHREYPTPACATCVPGTTWYEHLAEEQIAIQRWGLDEKTVYLGVDVADRSLGDRLAGRALADALQRQTRRLDDQVAEISDLLAGAGLAAAPASPRQMEWLMHRSAGLGLPPPLPFDDRPGAVPHALAPAERTRYEAGDLEEFTGRAHWSCEPFDRTVTITGHLPNGEPITRHVAVLTLGQMAPIETTTHTPWMVRTDALGFEVEWSVTFEVRPSTEVTREMRDKIARRRNQLRHYLEHDLDPPLELEEQAEESRRIEDEQQHGFAGLHARIQGWFRIAVAGASRAEALERAAKVAEVYEPGITVVHPADQYRLAREFIPGEPLANLAHRRRMPVTMLAAGMPQATSTIGDPDGFFVGITSSVSYRAVTWAPWRGPEVREESGLVPVIGGLGAGKSSLAGLVTYKAAKAGVPAAVLDPAGMLARLCRLPDLAPHAKAIDLLHAEPGTLCPYRVIADPCRAESGLDADGHRLSVEEAEARYRADLKAAQAQRRSLTYDVLRWLLEPDLVDKETIFSLKEAVAAAPATEDASPWQVIEALDAMQGGLAERARLIARDLERTASHPQAQLFFPSGAHLNDRLNDQRHLDQITLTVLTLNGLVIPSDDVPPAEWSTEERFSIPLLHLAAWHTHRLVYGRPRDQRKLLVIDEAHAITRSPVGRMLLNTTARDSRKRNVVALTCSQNARDLLEAGIGNLQGPAFVGRTEGATEQAQALQLLGLEAGAGYEEVLAGLSMRQGDERTGHRDFIMRLAGQLDRVQIDIGPHTALRAALDTTANPTGTQRRPPSSPPGTGATQTEEDLAALELWNTS